jgi:phenylacetate-CoA ligase
MLWPHQRQLIETAFRSPVYNFYGSREVANLAAECPEGRKMHLISTWRFVEIVDHVGRPLPDGSEGSIVVTDMSNFVMPFIRYRNDDVGAMSADLCECGRPSPVVGELLGRSTDLIRTPRGDIIHGEFFTHLFYGREDIVKFQVHQTALDHVLVRYVPREGRDAEFEKTLKNRIAERLGAGVAVEIEVCDEILLPPSGKHRFTISSVGE